MPSTVQLLTDLAHGASYCFSEWPNSAVPGFGAGVYAIWQKDGRFIYVGMSGRGITSDTAHRNRPHGIYTRLRSHASGRRSGDQFCVYVADRLVLPKLSQEDIAAIASGRHQMDAFVRKYIHDNLTYRFVILPDGAAAYGLEATIKDGKWEHGRPLLNPRGSDEIRLIHEGEGPSVGDPRGCSIVIALARRVGSLCARLWAQALGRYVG